MPRSSEGAGRADGPRPHAGTRHRGTTQRGSTSRGTMHRGAMYRRTLGRTAAALAVIVATMVAFSFVVGPWRPWVHRGLGPLLVLTVMLWLLRQNAAGTAALEASNAELGDVIAEAQDARARAEGEARQKARLAALLD